MLSRSIGWFGAQVSTVSRERERGGSELQWFTMAAAELRGSELKHQCQDIFFLFLYIYIPNLYKTLLNLEILSQTLPIYI